MKLYSKRFVQRSIDKNINAKQETRDAILWDVLDNYTCRVKIQGSDEYVIAHYPRNWKSTPYWLKKGNAVRILHRGGNRGYVEVIGEGRAIPTALSGSSTPDEADLPDGVVSECTITSMKTAMGVIFSGGTFRINGTVYTLSVNDQYLLFDSEDYVLYDSEDDYKFFLPDSGDITMYMDAAPSVGQFRYDAFCVGIDGVIDYIKGTASSTPTKPIITADHVLIGDYILVCGGATVIENKDIGRQWTTPYASSIDINIESSGISYNVTSSETEADIVLKIFDQYGNVYSSSTQATLTQNLGGGAFSETNFTIGSSKTIKWSRNGETAADAIVVTVVAVSGGQTLTAIGMMTFAALVV